MTELPNKIILVYGSRQSGKTTLAREVYTGSTTIQKLPIK